jgi:hypothetical protein
MCFSEEELGYFRLASATSDGDIEYLTEYLDEHKDFHIDQTFPAINGEGTLLSIAVTNHQYSTARWLVVDRHANPYNIGDGTVNSACYIAGQQEDQQMIEMLGGCDGMATTDTQE